MIFNFLAILHDLQCAFLIFHVFHCSSLYSDPTVLCLVFHLFVSSPYSWSFSLCFNFSHFSVFLAIFHVLQSVFLILHDFQFSFHTLGPTVCISHFSSFSVFLPYSRSYIMHFSFFKFFSVSCHISCPTVCASHFP